MNAYEQKRAIRLGRMADRADKLRASAAADFRKADLREEVSGIPFGQPILVGHHSEGKHRRALAKADNAMRRGIDAERKADELDRRAANPSTAISSDDPNAPDKLRAEIAAAEARRDLMTAANKIVRAAIKAGVRDLNSRGWAEYVAKLQALHPFSASTAGALLKPDCIGRTGFADYQLSNLGANIRRMRQRLVQVEALATVETTEATHACGVRIVENAEENRLQLIFDGKPAAEVRAALKSAGFRWAPSSGAWQRHLNNGARHAAERVLAGL